VAGKVTNYVDTNIINGNAHTRAEFGTHAAVFVGSFFVGGSESKAGAAASKFAESAKGLISKTKSLTNRLIHEETGSTNIFNRMFSRIAENEIPEVDRGITGLSGVGEGTGELSLANGEADAVNYAKLKEYYNQIGERVPQRSGYYSGNLIKAKQADLDADLLGQRINGESRVYFEDDLNYSRATQKNQYEKAGAREFDAVSDEYIAQTKPATVANSTEYRNQVYATFDAARQNGKLPYFHFEGGTPSNEIIDVLNNYSNKFDIKHVLDTNSLK
jgi:hypothetical protein